MKSTRSPRLARRIAQWAGRKASEPAFVHDVDMLFAERLRVSRRLSVHLWYWREVLVFAWSAAVARRPNQPSPLPLQILRDGLVDLRHGWRVLLRVPGYSLLSIVILASGIGATSAMFAIIDAVLLKPLAVANPDRLATVLGRTVTESEMETWRESLTSFDGVSGFSSAFTTPLAGSGPPQAVRVTRISADYFQTLGVTPDIGRQFTSLEELAGAPGVAIISARLWHTVLGADSAILGAPIKLNGALVTIVGVLPDSFEPLQEGVDVWLPLQMRRDHPSYNGRQHLTLIARLSESGTYAAANAELRSRALALGIEDDQFVVEPIARALVASVRTTLILLMGAVLLLLTVACVNIANLQLARGAYRQREVVIRTALGAHQMRILRQFVTENLLLGAIGGVLGFVAAHGFAGAATRLLPVALPRVDVVTLDFKIFGFAFLVACVCSLVFGMLPAMKATESAGGMVPQAGLAHLRSRDSTAYIGRWLVVLQIAASVVLMVNAVLIVRSLRTLFAVDLGFNSEGVVVLQVQPEPKPEWTTVDFVRVFEGLHEAVIQVRGVSSVGLSHLGPFGSAEGTAYSAVGSTLPDDQSDGAIYRMVSGTYFNALGIPLLAGRTFGAQDRFDAPPVAMINETLASRLWPNESAVGKIIDPFGHSPVPTTIVGVVADTRQTAITEVAAPEIYRPFTQTVRRTMMFVIQSSLPPSTVVPQVQSTLRRADPGVLISHVQSLDELVQSSVATTRFLAALLLGFGGFSLLLSTVGIYGLTAFVMGRREREFGVKVAIGGTPQQILRSVMTVELLRLSLGVGVGAGLSILVSHLLDSHLYGVSSVDLLSILSVSIGSAFIAALSVYWPSRSILRTDPAASLRAMY